MDDIKLMARQAKQRMKKNFWEQCKKDVESSALIAKEKGLNEMRIKSGLYGKVKRTIRGEEVDEFYEKVKELLDTYGEVSDAIGRLTDKEHFATLTYGERQRYTLELSEKYLKALDKYKREKEIAF